MSLVAPLTKLHPRTAKYYRYWERRRLHRRNALAGTISSGRQRTDEPGWTDYFPEFPGTRVEKIVFKALVDLGITFYFGAYWGDMPFTTDFEERYRPDFILPEYRIVIEVFGAYWHSLESSYKRDSVRASMFEAAGYKFIILWDYEVLNNPFAILDTIPELVNPAIKTGQVYVADRPFNPTASLAARQRSVPKVVRLKTGRANRYPQRLSRYKAYLVYPGTEKTPGKYYRFAGFPEEYLASLRKYSQEWKDYFDSLSKFFLTSPQYAGYYSSYYHYWAKWYGWWDRFQRITEEDWTAYFAALEGYLSLYPDQREVYLNQYNIWKRSGIRSK